MSKQIRAGELASVVTRILTTPVNEDSSSADQAYQAFMTEIAEVVCKFACG